MTAILTETGHRFTGRPETVTDGPKVTLLFAATEPIALASIEVGLVRATVVCSVGINLTWRDLGLNRPSVPAPICLATRPRSTGWLRWSRGAALLAAAPVIFSSAERKLMESAEDKDDVSERWHLFVPAREDALAVVAWCVVTAFALCIYADMCWLLGLDPWAGF
jgi:hypothetical protein